MAPTSRRLLRVSDVIPVVGLILVAASMAEARVLAEDGDTVAQVRPCTLLPAGFCTFDRNMCGGSSVCGCPEGYSFNQSVGLCLIDDVELATGPGDMQPPRLGYEDKCVQPSSGGCDMKVANACGFQSVCFCDEEGKYEWSPQVGKCLLKM